MQCKIIPIFIFFSLPTRSACRCDSDYAHRAATNTCEECSGSNINSSFFLVLGAALILFVVLVLAKYKLRRIKDGGLTRDWASRVFIGLGLVEVSPGDASSIALLHAVKDLKIRIFARLKVFCATLNVL